MDTRTFERGSHIISAPIACGRLVIEQGAELAAPQGKYLTLSVNGVGKPLVPGTYNGQVVISVTEELVEGTYPSVRRRNPIPLKTAIAVKDGKLLEGQSASALVHGGTVTDTSADDVFIATSEEDFAGIVVDGEGDYTINRARMAFDGSGSNDFVGMGAGVASIGNANVTINDSEFSLSSVTRCAVHVGGTGTVTVNNSRMTNISPEVEMGSWSWGIAIRGTNRLNQLADDGTVYYNGCTMRSNGWGILSVDGSNYAHMHVKDSDMELEGPNSHGYGVFCIGPTDIHLDNVKLRVNGFPILLRGMERKGIMEITNGCQISGRRFGLHSQGDTGSVVTIADSSFKTDKATLLIKGSTGTVYNISNTTMEPGDGQLLQLIDSDDPGLQGTFVDVSMYDRDDTYLPGRELSEFDPENDITLNISGCALKGNMLNSTSDLVNQASKTAPAELVIRDAVAPGELGNEGKISGMPPVGDLPPMGGGGMPPMGGMPGGPGGGPGGMPGGMPEGMPPMGGMPGGPGGPGGAPGGAPGGMPFMMGETPKNLVVNLKSSSIEGVISSAKQKYEDGLKFLEETIREELSHVYQTPAPTVNNGVLVTLDAASTWTVTGTSYISRLDVAEGAVIQGPEGKTVKLTVDGVEKPLVPGSYKGHITLEV